MQLALAPLVPHLDGPAHVFGVSGYSGAGKKPSPRNDPELLRDNLLPYALVNHVHEREVSHQLGTKVFFAPHVAPFFRGITVTVSCALKDDVDVLEQPLEQVGEQNDRRGSTLPAMPPSAGPSTNPTPKATPSIPNSAARRSGAVTSAT